MNRDVEELVGEPYDLLVVGGGVVGAWTAREAARRGWRTALIEAADFASGASWNSLKIVHGGLRYLQRLAFRRMRESIRERSTLIRVAPHLVHPLPVLVPAFSSGLQRRFLLEAASRCNDVVSWDRNRGLPSERRLPATRVLSRSECLEMLPTRPSERVTGGIIFYDAQLYAAERLVFEIVKDAAERGATVANHVECRGRLDSGSGPERFLAVDRATGDELEIRARALVNATGASAVEMAEVLTGQRIEGDVRYSVALNLVLDPMEHEVACTLPAQWSNPGARIDVGKRQLLFVPWRGQTLVGTGHYSYTDRGRARYEVDEVFVDRFVSEVISAAPELSLSRDDVRLVHGGLLPEAAGSGDGVDLLSRGRVIDHSRKSGPPVVTAVSVKFTTARALAERALRSVARLLERPPGAGGGTPPLLSAVDPGEESPVRRAARELGDSVDDEVAEHLDRYYGSAAGEVLSLAASVPAGLRRLHPASPVVAGQLLHAARHEMAATLEDILQRRTELGPRGLVNGDVVERSRAFLTRHEAGVGMR